MTDDDDITDRSFSFPNPPETQPLFVIASTPRRGEPSPFERWWADNIRTAFAIPLDKLRPQEEVTPSYLSAQVIALQLAQADMQYKAWVRDKVTPELAEMIRILTWPIERDWIAKQARERWRKAWRHQRIAARYGAHVVAWETYDPWNYYVEPEQA